MPNIADEFCVSYGDFATDMSVLSDHSIRYLLQYGFAQTLQDARAGSAKEVRDTAAACVKGGDGFDKAFAKWNRLIKAAGAGESDYEDADDVSQLAGMKAEADMRAKFNAILSGEIGTGAGGVRLDPVERTMRTIAEREIRAAIAAHNSANPSAKMAMPKGDDLAALVGDHILENGDDLRAKAEAEIAATQRAAAGAAGILAKLVKKA